MTLLVPATRARFSGSGAAQGATIAVVAFVVAALAWAVTWYAGLRPDTNVSIPREFGAVLAFGAILVGLVPAAALGAIAGGVAQPRGSALAGVATGLLAGLLGVGAWWALEYSRHSTPASVPFPWPVFAILALPAAVGGGIVGWRAGAASIRFDRAAEAWIGRASDAAMRAAETAGRAAEELREGQPARRVAQAGLHRATMLFLVGVALAVFSFVLQLAVPEFHVANESDFLLAALLRGAAQPWTWLAKLAFAGKFSSAVTVAWAAASALGLGLNGVLAGALLAAVREANPAVAPPR